MSSSFAWLLILLGIGQQKKVCGARVCGGETSEVGHAKHASQPEL